MHRGLDHVGTNDGFCVIAVVRAVGLRKLFGYVERTDGSTGCGFLRSMYRMEKAAAVFNADALLS